MKIAVFTSNQPRHKALINRLSMVADVTSIIECTTIRPGQTPDFYKKSAIMQEYFGLVQKAENDFFGQFNSVPGDSLPIKMGDLNRLSRRELEFALGADRYIVFGASYIKGWLIDFLIDHLAINIHMGTSPYYRGAACNMWAFYDGNPDMIGATIHLLSKGIDSGDILTCVDTLTPHKIDYFHRGMLAVDRAIEQVCRMVELGLCYPSWKQDASKLIRYSRGSDFTDEIATAVIRKNQSID